MFYLENFQLPKEDRRVYPYGLLGMKGLEHIEFALIKILYGNNINGRIKKCNKNETLDNTRNKTL